MLEPFSILSMSLTRSFLDFNISDNRSSDDSDSDSPTDYDDPNPALINKSNIELRERPAVRSFLEEIREYTTLEQAQTRMWLEKIPRKMCREAIPLFSLRKPFDGLREDYQLHPRYTGRKATKLVEKPHVEIVRISGGEERRTLPEQLKIVIFVGQLFFRDKVSTKRYKAKWTGYEVIVDIVLDLWIIFNKEALRSPDPDEYRQRCLLWRTFGQDHIFSRKDKPHFVDLARLCRLRDIEAPWGVSIVEVSNSVRQSSMIWKNLQVLQIDRRENLIFREKMNEAKSARLETPGVRKIYEGPSIGSGSSLPSVDSGSILPSTGPSSWYGSSDENGSPPRKKGAPRKEV